MTPRSRLLNRRTLLGGAAATMLASTAIRPLGAGAQDATPAAGQDTGGIAGLLPLVPASFPWVDEQAQVMFSYADIATQLDVTGVDLLDSVDDPGMSQWIAATHMLAVPGPSAEHLKAWRGDYGFDLFQVDETLEVSLPPFDLSLFRGRFDLDAVRAALVNSGYREIEVDGHLLHSLREDYEQDLTSPLAYKLAAMNHVALMDDGTIACSSVRGAVEATFAVAAGAVPSLIEQAGIATLAEHAPAALVTATIADGSMLAETIPDPGATPATGAIAPQAGEMPPVTMVLVGVTAGGVVPGDNGGRAPDTPGARAVAVAVLETPESAEAAVPVVEERLETGASVRTGEPWSRYISASTVAAVEGAPVLLIDLTVSENTAPTILVQMLMNRDPGFLAW